MLRTAAAFAAVLLLSLSPVPAAAWQVDRSSAPLAQAGDIQRFQLGDLRITALSDRTVPQDLHELLLGITPQEVDELLDRAFLKNPVEASINVFLLETREGLVLIDAGAGEVFGPGYGGRLIDSLAAAGVDPLQIRHVLITHVHSDHSGGLVVKGRPVFPNAVITLASRMLISFSRRKARIDEAMRTVISAKQRQRFGPIWREGG